MPDGCSRNAAGRLIMEILGKNISPALESLYHQTASKTGVPVHFERLPEGWSKFGHYRLEKGIARIVVCTDIPKAAFEHCCAHELVHALQDAELWPRTHRRLGLPDTSPESKVGTELGSLVRDLDVEERLRPLGFESGYEDEFRYKASMKGISNEAIPSEGIPMWCLWSLRYAYLFFTQMPRRWKRLRQKYLERAPSIAKNGEEIVAIIRKHGCRSQDQALQSMIAIRDSLGLATDERCRILDARTNALH